MSALTMNKIHRVLFPCVTSALIFAFNCDDAHQNNTHGFCPAREPQLMYIRGTNILIRESPGTDASVAGKLQGGRSVFSCITTENEETIGAWSGVWHQIMVNTGPERGKTGWVFGAFLVPESEGPGALMESIDHQNPESALEDYLYLQKYYPEFEEGGGLEPYEFMVRNEININRCWIDRMQPQTAGKTESEVRQAVINAIQTKNSAALKDLASCEFVFMENYCVGDPPFGPITQDNVARIFALAPRINWNEKRENCFRLKPDSWLCLSVAEKFDVNYLYFVCHASEDQIQFARE